MKIDIPKKELTILNQLYMGWHLSKEEKESAKQLLKKLNLYIKQQ